MVINGVPEDATHYYNNGMDDYRIYFKPNKSGLKFYMWGFGCWSDIPFQFDNLTKIGELKVLKHTTLVERLMDAF